MIIPAPDPSMMMPAPDSSVMVQVPGPQLTSVSVTMPSQNYRTLSRNNSFRRAKDEQLQSWMTETAQLLAKIQALNARREVLPPAASHDSLYENPAGDDASLTFGLSEATGWHYKGAPPRPGNPLLPPLPPPPVRTSSLRLKGVAKTLAIANQKKKGEQQMPTSG